MLTITALVALPCLLRIVEARALWIPEEIAQDASFWVPEDFTITKRADTCGGDRDLTQCGSGFPSDFCCGESTVCLSLNTTSTITAALCCPAGQDCSTISPVSCDQTFQNATSNPGSQLHSDPTAKLDTCGDACCPMGFKCSGTLCIAMTESEVANGSSTTSSGTTSSALITTSSTASSTQSDPASSSTSSAEAAATTDSLSESEDSSDDFSGKSFAAGFIPGIIIGMLLLGALIFCLHRRKQKKNGSISEKRHYSKDTLTDLGPNNPSRRPTVHGRSISEPTVDISLGHRTDFANRTPPGQKSKDVRDGLSGYIVNVESPAPRPANPTPQGKGYFSRSPFVNQVATPKPIHSPLPSHLKRGTLSFDSFKISPVRGLKKQRSMHSLRRQSQQAPTARLVDDRPEHMRQQSTETINVAMDTPGLMSSTARTLPSASYKPHFAQLQPTETSSKSWQTTYSSRSQDTTPIEEEPDYSTPSRPGRNSNIANIGASLQSPYTPSNYPVTVYDQRASTRTQPQVTYPPVKATSATQPYPTPQSSEAHKSFVAPVGHTSTFADTGMPFLRSPNLQPPSPAYAPGGGAGGKGKSKLTGLFPNWAAGGEERDHRVTRSSGLTTWGGMIEKAGLRRSQLYTRDQGDPRQWNR
ncbi:hypothetical protein Slin14017_G110950 [Septoria linicola]|nr:hypothetical protein Slin14017_G110950 [Septoria linicola]